MANKILLFNPRSANYKARVPNSVLQVAASVEGKFPWVLVDGNLENDPWEKIESYFSSGEFKYFCSTVMPGPQLRQAIPYSKKIKAQYPGSKVIWGGYFAANQAEVCLRSGFVDFVINGPGDNAFPQLIQALEENSDFTNLNNLVFLQEGKIVKTHKEEIPESSLIPHFPYDKLNEFYPLQKYLGKSFLGRKTFSYHSSFGCPFTCSFCAVVPIYKARWKGMTADKIYSDVTFVKKHWGADAIEFYDNNFFVSEKRTAEFSRLMLNENMSWWGEGRIDTLDKYSDDTLALMKKAGCEMIFFGAESGSVEVLASMDKGGKQNPEQTLSFAGRLRKFGIVPEYSFVLGTPGKSPEDVSKKIDEEIEFIRKVKKVNPDAEIIIYVYSPVPVEGSELYEKVKANGFLFPETLEEWLNPKWLNFDLRKNPLTPWLNAKMIDKIRNFETVLNGYFPTKTDIRLNKIQRKLIRIASSIRYKTKINSFPLEIKVLQKIWKYRQPEIEGA